jgi:hypothetical protein
MIGKREGDRAGQQLSPRPPVAGRDLLWLVGGRDDRGLVGLALQLLAAQELTHSVIPDFDESAG